MNKTHTSVSVSGSDTVSESSTSKHEPIAPRRSRLKGRKRRRYWEQTTKGKDSTPLWETVNNPRVESFADMDCHFATGYIVSSRV
jgi:hypothetical protein